jgi:diguanylate cyclase (GGDEF)-like protein/PAS domain S-box-containing protein
MGYEESRLLDLTFQEITHPDDLEADLDQVQRVLSGELRSYQLEKRYVVEDGRLIWVMLSVSLVRDSDGTPRYFVSQIEDITDRKAAERDLERLAYRDPLTGLLNRRRFGETLEYELARMRRYGGLAALLVIDVDRFKRVNDSIGHKAGDDVLCAVAETLRRRLRVTDVAARMGGDEFAVLGIGVKSAEEARTIAADIAEAIRSQSILTSGRAVQVTVSIGVAILDPQSGTTEDSAFVTADDAMYQAKRSGRDRIALAA